MIELLDPAMRVWRSRVAEHRESARPIPGLQQWTWRMTGGTHDQVRVEAGKVIWSAWHASPHLAGGATEQSFADFLDSGPPFSGVGEDVLASLLDAVLAQVG
ncbi:MAG: hypothetical protein HYY06_31750 [Deltaproteobacteria bacterium]|nr:hypothetical protein [Deltaproteobacteria bacterium]